MDDSFEKALFLVAGWLMGLLAPAITDGIRRRRENRLGRAAIYAELREIAHKVALAAHGVHVHQGTVDRSRLEWIKGVLERYAGANDSQRLLDNFRQQLTWSDAEIAAGARAFAGRTGQGLVLQKYGVPLLDARVSALWSFESPFTLELLEIRSSIDLLNDLVDRSRYCSDLTFKLDGDNHDAVVDNFRGCCADYAERAVRVAERIENLRVHV